MDRVFFPLQFVPKCKAQGALTYSTDQENIKVSKMFIIFLEI